MRLSGSGYAPAATTRTRWPGEALGVLLGEVGIYSRIADDTGMSTMPWLESISVAEAFTIAAANRASDLAAIEGEALRIVVGGKHRLVEGSVLSAGSIFAYVGAREAHGDSRSAKILARDGSADFDDAEHGGRVHVYRTSRGLALAARLLPDEPPRFENLGLPPALGDLTALGSGLILICGPMGAGKSTALHAMVDRINREGSRGILTLERPIEYHHHPIGGTWLAQQEVGRDIPDYGRGVRSAMRANVGVIAIGEVQEAEEAAATLDVAEKGPLVIATTHARNAAQAVESYLSFFDGDDAARRRLQFANAGVAIIALRLIPRLGGRPGEVVPAYEFLRLSKIRHLIREGKFSDIRAHIAAGRAEGMVTLEACLNDLVAAKTIRAEDARRAAVFPDEIKG